MNDTRYKAVIDSRLATSRRVLIDYLDQGIAEIRGELIYLNAARKRGTLRPRHVIRKIISSRLRRSQLLPHDLFAEPAWDILLALTLARIENRQVASKEAALAASVPATTAKRWVTALEEKGLIERIADPEDGRRIFIALTDEGWAAMHAWLECVTD